MSKPQDRYDPTDAIDKAAQDWFLRLSSGSSTSAERASFAAWCEADPRHRAAYEEVRELWEAIDDLEPAFAGTAAAQRIRWTRGRATARSWRRRAALIGVVAACALLVVGIATDLPTLLKADHSTGIGESATIALPDGSVAYLNTDTAIAVDYSPDRRRVSLLRGEALFEVAEDRQHPFDVLALDGRSTAVGTAFIVRATGKTATVTVTEGTVQVEAPLLASVARSGEPESVVTLEAGERVSYRQGGGPGPVAAVDTGTATAWRNGLIVIDGLPLADALAEIDRYRPGKIVLLTDTSQAGLVTARISLRSLDGGIEALAATHGLSVTLLTDFLMVIH